MPDPEPAREERISASRSQFHDRMASGGRGARLDRRRRLHGSFGRASGECRAAPSAQATVNAKISGVTDAADQAVTKAKSTASGALDNAKTNASQAVDSATAKASQVQATAGQAVANATATVNQDVATAAQQAQRSIHSSQAAAQANLAKATSEGQSVLAKANADYAYLLSLNEQAVLNQLPEGSATGATVQNGIFLFLIEGS